jgi:hypothetical protein
MAHFCLLLYHSLQQAGQFFLYRGGKELMPFITGYPGKQIVQGQRRRQAGEQGPVEEQMAEKKALLFLFMDGLAPLLGVLLTSVITFPKNILAILLAVFAGEFIYVGAASLLPESQEHSILCLFSPWNRGEHLTGRA